jgi:sugar phosphate permease
MVRQGERMKKSDTGSIPHASPHVGAAPGRWWISIVLLIAVMTAFFDRINIAVLFGDSEFQTAIGTSDPGMMGLLMTAFLVPYGASILLFSISGDFFGPRKTLSAIAAILAATMALMGSLSSYVLMLVGRIVLGLAEGPQFGTATATVKRWFPRHEQGRANALWTIGSPLGSAIGFPLVIFLNAQFSWRVSFFALAALNAFIVLPILWYFLKDRPPDSVAAFAPRAQTSSFAEALSVLVRDWKIWLITIYNCGAMIFLWGFNSWLPTYLREARQFDVAATGFYSSLPFVLMLAGMISGAWLGDRTGRRAFVCGFGLFFTGTFIYLAAIAPDATNSAIFLAISAGCWGATVPTLFAMGMQIIPAKITAAGFGVYAGISNLVASTAPWIMGVLIGSAGNYAAGLQFLVLSCILCSLVMIPLTRKY